MAKNGTSKVLPIEPAEHEKNENVSVNSQKVALSGSSSGLHSGGVNAVQGQEFKAGGLGDFVKQPDDKQPDDKQPDDKQPDDKQPDDKQPDAGGGGDFPDNPFEPLIDFVDSLQCEAFAALGQKMGKKIPSSALLFTPDQRKHMQRFFEIAAPAALAKLANSPILQAAAALAAVGAGQYMKVRAYEAGKD